MYYMKMIDKGTPRDQKCHKIGAETIEGHIAGTPTMQQSLSNTKQRSFISKREKLKQEQSMTHTSQILNAQLQLRDIQAKHEAEMIQLQIQLDALQKMMTQIQLTMQHQQQYRNQEVNRLEWLQYG